MKSSRFKKWLPNLNTRVGLVWASVFFIWLKTMIAYFFVFNHLHSADLQDYLLMIVNPIGFTAIFIALSLFISRTALFYTAIGFWNFFGTLLVYGNVVYYREFADFLSINTLTGGAGMMGKGFDYSAIPVQPLDFIYWLDIIIIVVLFLLKKIKIDQEPYGRSKSFRQLTIAVMIFMLTFMGADMTEHRLVSRQAQYDDTYVVRYLGLGPWLVTDGWYTHVANEARNMASKSDFTKVQQYIAANRYLAPNVSVYGKDKNKNLIVIHLESFQQDLIDKSIDGKPVTPFLDSLYHSNSTIAFSNFFNQVGQGKTSDAENMLETSTFGLPTGSLFQSLGSTQTFQAMPAILNQTEGYSSAVFHGNVGTFYNRVNVYRNMGYQNFFDQSFWSLNSQDSTAWGLKDKDLFYDSVPYLEQLQQPFYVKYLTVTNHTPFTGLTENELDPNFKTVNSGDPIVDNYFLTAHYLDQSVEEFFNYLKASGLYNKSIIVIYGDHYGISGSDDKFYLPYLGQTNVSSAPLASSSSSSSSSEDAKASTAPTWNDYDEAMMQRVPFMIVTPGSTDGYINNEFAGEIDVMPTLEHLLGISTQNYIQFGQDLFAKGRQQFVALRNRGFITPTITEPNPASNEFYDTTTGQQITPTASQVAYINEIQTKVNTMLNMSDALNSEDLLRFYTPAGFTPVNASNYTYTVSATQKRLKQIEDSLKAKSTSLYSENHNVSTQSLYQSDEPGMIKSKSALAIASSSSKGGK
ncbi:MAG: LTA synthase family protein [Streptococcaceae bacterium]|jgi:lipoteichoic acid synthase|nr:LTA synthase family protein [Streptococcaceae bacterium]